jgi:hypothetical protein
MPDTPDPSAPFSTEASRAESVARFHAGLAHDLNNRLTTILGNLLLFESLYPDEKDSLEDMRRAAEEASNLVRLVQTFTKREILPPHPVSVNETLRTLHELLQRLLGPSRRLSVVLSDEPVYLYGDEGTLEQLVAESIGRMSADGDLCLRVASAGGDAVIFCEGGDCPDGDDAFRERLKPLKAVLSPEPSGWRLCFPACRVDSGDPPEPPPSGKGRHLLLAEGDPLLRRHLTAFLADAGFEVTPVADVKQAGEVLLSAGPFDLAALDTRLPGGGGAALASLTGLPAARVWMPPFAGENPQQEGSVLSKPFAVLELHRALMRTEAAPGA